MNSHRTGRGRRLLGVGALALSSLSCQSRGRTPQPARPPPGTGAIAPQAVEARRVPGAPRWLGVAPLVLPGSTQPRPITFETINGLAVYQGDIMLGPATALALRYGVPRQALDQKGAVARADESYLWPGGELPYAIDASAQPSASAIAWAVQQFAGTALRLRPRVESDRDYVVFRRLGEGCWSYLGRVGGAQDIDVTECGAGSIAHEIMHAAGFYHEQSRGDRDEHVTIVWDEISPEMRPNFEKRDERGRDIGPYDYASIMHYASHAGSRAGNATIVPKVSGANIGQRDGLSVLDRAALATLYGGAPAASAPQPAAAAPAPTRAPAPAPAPAPVPSAPAPSPTPAPAASPVASTSLAGAYSSSRGNVTCTEGGVFIQCQHPGGNMLCVASGATLSCTWTGGGQGRAIFQRQPSGVLAGTWGDAFSATSRGRWDLVPLAASAPTAAPTPAPRPSPAPPAAPTPTPAPAARAASLSGNFDSTRGAMACVESGAGVSCNFREPDGVNGRLDCAQTSDGQSLSCGWITYLPRAATGRAAFSRSSPSERRFSGTWGYFLSDSGGGRWDLQGR